MSNKKETIIEHWLYMWFSPKYRAQMMLEKGEQLWRETGKGLARPVGVLEDDELRIRQFVDRFRTTLNEKEQRILIMWLEHQLCELEHKFSEDVSAGIEEFERKWKQIYRTHLEAVSEVIK